MNEDTKLESGISGGMTHVNTAKLVDEYFKKPYHYAKFINDKGEVSALCFKKPHAINLKIESWTNRKEAVTCEKCKAKLNDNTKS
jgi:hypothetical protein